MADKLEEIASTFPSPSDCNELYAFTHIPVSKSTSIRNLLKSADFHHEAVKGISCKGSQVSVIMSSSAKYNSTDRVKTKGGFWVTSKMVKVDVDSAESQYDVIYSGEDNIAGPGNRALLEMVGTDKPVIVTMVNKLDIYFIGICKVVGKANINVINIQGYEVPTYKFYMQLI